MYLRKFKARLFIVVSQSFDQQLPVEVTPDLERVSDPVTKTFLDFALQADL
jgi:hypothetical protein